MLDPIRAVLATLPAFTAQVSPAPPAPTPTGAAAAAAAAAAPAQQGLDYFEIIAKAGPVVLMVLLLLALASVVSWAIIVRKAIQVRKAQRESVAFLEAFWQSKRLDAIYETADQLADSPISQVFKAGYVELTKISKDEPSARSQDDLENVERALRRASTAELTHLEATTPFLATVGSASPFVGLFGTVWGIMQAFHDIYQMGNANLATVARPISEALIATAVGLFAAIPAVVAYNHFLARIRVLESEMDNFSIDFLNIIKRHFFKKAA